MKKSFVLLLYIALVTSAFSQKTTTDDINAIDIKQHISYLASDALRGRMTGSGDDVVAAEYIKKQFLNFNLKPLCEKGFQYFNTTVDVEFGTGNSMSFQGFKGKLDEDFCPFSFSKNGLLKAQTVFVGYGFDISKDSIQWNDYKDVDVKGKWAVIMRGEPDPDNMHSPYFEFSQERYKVTVAKNKGAAGVIFITGKSQEKDDKIVHLYFDKNVSDSDIPVISINRTVADKILQKTKKSLIELETLINKEKKSNSFSIPLEISANSNVKFKSVKTQNVVFLLEGSDVKLKDEYIVLGAHYDHLGMGGKGSGSRMPDTVAVHNGADDNASGVAAVIELAEKISSMKQIPKRSIIFVAFTGEEMGMLGSDFFVKNPPIEKTKIKSMLNFDMIGRMKSDKKTLSVSGTGTSIEWESILDKYKGNRTFELAYSPEGPGPSDHAKFYYENIPVLFFTTGAHDDYHTPMDDTEKIDFDSEKNIIDLAFDVLTDISNSDKNLTFKEAGPKQEKVGVRFKVKLGIMPDYTGTIKNGLSVDGVSKGGSADKGGIKKNDVIISVDGMKVSNIDDYMVCLSKLKQGKIIPVEVMRAGKKEVLLITLL